MKTASEVKMMRKFPTLLILAIFCCISMTAWAGESRGAETQSAVIVQTDANKETTNTEKKASAETDKSKKKKASEDMLEACVPIETITVEEMQQRLKQKSEDDLLYVKIGESKVELYQGLAADRSLRKQLILKLPNTEMLRLYTTNKATYEQMNKMLSDYERSNANFNGYRIITDKDNPQKLEDGGKVYRFWFMKIEREKSSRRGAGFPIGIGIGIGIGGHHHHHHGPWVGVGL